MKKLITVAVLAAAASVASAETKVEVFGFLDQGLTFIHENSNKGMMSPVGQRAPNVLKNGKVARQGAKSRYMEGTGNVSTWGIKAREELNSDWSVLVHLEQGFLADDGVAGEADTLDAVGQAIPHAEGVALVVHVAEYDEAAVERPRRGHGDAGDIGDLAEVAAGGFGDPHVALVLAAVLHKGERGKEEVAVSGEGFHKVGAEAVGQSRFTMVDMGNNRKIAYMLLIHCVLLIKKLI